MKDWQQIPSMPDIHKAKLAIEKVVRESPCLLPIGCDFQQPIDLLDWLSKSESNSKLYWSNRNNLEAIAGIGVSDVVRGKGILQKTSRLAQERNRRYFGGLFFNGEFEQMWAPLWWTNGKSLVYNPPIENSPDLIDALPFKPESKPNKGQWMAIMTKAMAHLESENIDKIVLARQTHLKMNQNAYLCLQHLERDQTPGYAFAFQPAGKHIFIGRSPERLFELREQTLKTEAIAGTRIKDGIEVEMDLMNSEKDRLEHKLVVDGIIKSLKTLGLQPIADPSPKIIESGSLIHLKTDIECQTNEAFNADRAISALHPTAAVCGSPTAKAFEMIESLEGFDRGWFAGPIGWCDSNASEFAVAIRSATFNGDDALIYAGAGIVRGSDPIMEWREIASKGGQYHQFGIKA